MTEQEEDHDSKEERVSINETAQETIFHSRYFFQTNRSFRPTPDSNLLDGSDVFKRASSAYDFMDIKSGKSGSK